MSGACATRRQRGFTLTELLVAVVVLGIVLAATLPMLFQVISSQQRVETRARLDRLRTALELVYRQQAWTIDGQTGQVLATGTQTIQPGALVPAQWADAMRLAGLTPDLLVDGWQRPWEVRISRRLTRTRAGVDVPYHTIALISNQGGDYDGTAGQTLDVGTAFDPATGTLTLGGRDVGVLVDGYPIWDALVATADAQVRSVAEAYSTWYRARARQSGGSLTADYFATRGISASWDSTAMAPTVIADCDVLSPDGLWGRPLWQVRLDQVLGLGNQATAPWGLALRVVNCAAPARSPQNGDAQPYSAVVAALLPNGARIEAVATGVAR